MLLRINAMLGAQVYAPPFVPLRHARVERLPEPLVRFRYHAESKTGRDNIRGAREALEIRLKCARGWRDRLLMTNLHRLKHSVLPRISRWPRMYS
jgi:hypothetical protein